MLACLPLELRLRGKSTTQSRGTPIYYADITLREGMTIEQALLQGRQVHAERQALAYDQHALDAVGRAGLGNGAFEDDIEDAQEVIDEFYPETMPKACINAAKKPSLTDKLEKLAESTQAITT